MFLRIFRYRVRPELRDRHLALQAQAARLYEKYVRRRPSYFRRAADPNTWVELHWYEDRQECHKVAAAVAADPDLARLWKEFQETLDPDFPTSLEEFNEYDLPSPVSVSPFAQPPIDTKSRPVTRPVVQPPAEEPITSEEVVQASEPPAPSTPEPSRPAVRAAVEPHVESIAKPSEREPSSSHLSDAIVTEPPSADEIVIEDDQNLELGELPRHLWPARNSKPRSEPLPSENQPTEPPTMSAAESRADEVSKADASEADSAETAKDNPDPAPVENAGTNPTPPVIRQQPLGYQDGVWVVEAPEEPKRRDNG